MRKLISLALILLAIFFLVKIWWSSQLSGVSTDKSTKVFVISKGAGVSDVAKKLKEENLIKSELAFKIFVQQNNLASKLQAGSYKLSPSMSAQEILTILRFGSEDIRVTLIEGWRIEEMAQKLNTELKIDNKEFLKYAKEGFMFPDTYLFPKDYSAQQIVKRLKDTFDAKFSDNLKSKIKSLGLSENQGVILASIVEREARSGEVRTMVASILLKRFKIGMALNADATVQYALGYQQEEKSWWKRHLSKEDLKIDSLYNTYIHAGLPPASISNPGLASLKAVADADPSTQYLYYYHDSKGVSHYAKTLEEHNQNVANFP